MEFSKYYKALVKKSLTHLDGEEHKHKKTTCFMKIETMKGGKSI